MPQADKRPVGEQKGDGGGGQPCERGRREGDGGDSGCDIEVGGEKQDKPLFRRMRKAAQGICNKNDGQYRRYDLPSDMIANSGQFLQDCRV